MKHVTPSGMTYEVKKYHEHIAREGYAYTFVLHIDGKPAATVENRGDGGCLWVDWQSSGASSMWGTAGSEAATKVLQHIATLPPHTTKDFPEPLAYDMDLWLGMVAEEFVNDRRFGRLCKTKTVYRTEKDEEGSWRVVSRAYTPAFAAELRAHGAVEFWNERTA